MRLLLVWCGGKQLVQEQVFRVPLGRGPFRDFLAGVVTFQLLRQLHFELRGLHRRHAIAVKNAVDLAGVLGSCHNVHHAVLRLLQPQGAVQDAVCLGLLAKELHILLSNRKDAKLFVGAQHIREPYLALGSLLVLENGVQQYGNLFRPGPCDLDGVFTAI